MGRPLTLRGRKPTSSSSSSSSTEEFRNLLSVLYKVGVCFICNLKFLCKWGGIGGSRSDDLANWPFWTSPSQITRGWSTTECKVRWPSRHAPEELDSSELAPIQ